MPRHRGRSLPPVILVCVLAILATGVADAYAGYRETVAATPGLVSHWRLGEASGPTTVDQQASNSGTYLGSPSLGSAALLTADTDTAVAFDGVDDAVKVPNSLSLAMSSGVTFEAWVKRGSTSGSQTLFDKGHYFANFQSSGRLQFGLYLNNAWVQLVSPSNAFLAGTTYHVALAWDGTTMRIYKNGTELASKPATGTATLATSYNLILGADSNGYDAIGEYFPGTLDEVALYSRALSVSEIRQHGAVGWDDTTAPETSIASGPSGTTRSTSAAFDLTSTESNSTFECRLDGGAWSACGPTKTYAGLADGLHTFEARAADPSYNVDATPATREWTVERSAYGAAVRDTAGLVAYWRLGDTGGSTATDEVGTNHGTYFGSPTLGLGGLLAQDSDPAFTGDGTDDHVRVLDSPSIETLTALTWEAWVKPTTMACGAQMLDKNVYEVSFDCNADLRFHLRPNTIPTDLFSPSNSFTAGQTYHVAVTWDGTTMRLYKNGSEIASKSAAGTLTNNSHHLFLGAESGGTTARGRYFPGVIDDPALYNRALSTAELKRHYDLGLDPVPPQTMITSAPPSSSSSSTATFEFTSSEAASSFECRIDGGIWKACTSPRTYSSLDDGDHAFDVRATDSIGNVDPTPAARTWSVSTAQPAPGAGPAADAAAQLWVPNGPVRAVAASDHDSLYLGGSFTQIGPYTGHGVALDDQGAPTGSRPVNGEVKAVVPDGNGGWYIGGSFSRVGTAARDRLAHISQNGAVDPEWNPGANGTVNALVVSGGTVYAGGEFTSVGGQGRSRLAAIDSAGAVTGWAPGADNTVHALAAAGGTVYAGGQFATVGGLSRASIAAIDSAGSVTGWNPGATGPVYSLAPAGSLVYAGGNFTAIGGQPRTRLAAIDSAGLATGWSPNPNGQVNALAVTDAAVYAGGTFTSIGGQSRNRIAALDPALGTATTWNPNVAGSVKAVAVASSTVYIGGDFATVGGQSRNRLAAVHAASGAPTAWNPNADNVVSALAAAGSRVYAGGSFASVGGVGRNNLAEIDLDTGAATTWNPNAGNAVYALETAGSTVYTAGAFTQVGGQTRLRVAALDAAGTATSWNPGASSTVTALDVSGDTVYLAGSFATVGGQSRAKLAAVGVGGTVKPWNPSPDGVVNAIAASGDTLYAGGEFKNIGTQHREHLAALDPDGNATAWNPSPDLPVTALAAADGNVYAAGSFKSVALEPRTGLAAIRQSDGNVTSWNPGVSGGAVNAIAVGDSAVHIGGAFTSAGGESRTRLAAIDSDSGDATGWTPGPDAEVRAIAVPGRSVYAGGDFRILGGAGTERPNLAGFVAAPSNVTPPELAGEPVVGTGVATSDGTWRDATSYSYQWLRSGELLAGQTASSYTPTAADTGRPLSSRVTASNVAGSATADAAARIVEGAPVNDSPPTVSGTTQVGKLLSASDGAWRARPAPQISRQWRRCEADGTGCADISGATGPTYRALHADTGKTLRFSVTQANSHGSATVASAATAAIAPTDLPIVTLSHTPALAAGWATSYEDALSVSATDNAPGVAELEVANGQGTPAKFTHACATEEGACPETLAHTFNLSGADLPDGKTTVTAIARDDAGNVSDPETFDVRLDRADPVLSTSGPLKDAADELVGGSESLALDMSATDGAAGVHQLEVFVDGTRAAHAEQECAAGACDFEHELTVDLGEFDAGGHAVRAVATDQAGNTDEETWQLTTTDGLAPEIALSGALTDIEGESVTDGATYALHAVASDGSAGQPQSGVKSLEILVGDVSQELVEAPCPDGNCALEADFVFDPAAFTTGGHTVRIRATDESGEQVERTLIVIVHRPPVAPPLPENVASPVDESIDFIYSGTDPLQTGVASGTIDETRVAMVRGRVLTEDGAPLPGVAVTVDGHPEFGSTQTRADGEVYLAVNGGGPLTLRFRRDADGYMPADRTVEVPWQGYAQFEDVRLLKPDPDVDVVDLSGSALSLQSVEGPTASDGNGPRRPVLMFSAGTHGYAQMPNGTSVALGQAHIRLTEYTVGDAGPEALPGELPTQTAYTYAAEFSVDEAQTMGAETVRFTDALGAPKPAVSYNENFLDFAVGSTVPSGYYDRKRGVWVPEDSGQVVKVIGHTAQGAAVLDVKGKGGAATAAELAELGVTDAELARLGPLYSDGTELWRVPLSHLSAHDFNMSSYRPPNADTPPGSPQLAGPGGPDNPNCTSGSIILCETQALGEQVPVTGTPFSLAYQSDRVPGRKSEREIQIPLSDSTMPDQVKRIELTVEIAGKTYRRSFPDQRNLKHTFKWDGKDEFGRTVQGAQEATVRVDHIYPGLYTTPERFGSPGRTDENGEERTGRGGELSVGQTSKMIVSNWDATKLGLGGWTLDGHHAYDPVSRILHRGDGGRQSAESVNRAIRRFAGAGDPNTCAASSLDGRTARLGNIGRGVEGMELAPDGTLYFAGIYDSVWKVTPDGIFRHVAGRPACVLSNQPTSGGDGGPAKDAYFSQPTDVALDERGGLYIVDKGNHNVRYVDPAGTITTVAGNGTPGFSGDGGPATEAQLFRPFAAELAPDGTLYISDTANGRIRQLTTDGRIDTFAGDPNGVVWENARASRTAMSAPTGLSLAEDGSLYVVTDQRVRRISVGDRIKTVVGIPRKQGETPPTPEWQVPKLYSPEADGKRADAVRLFESFYVAVAPDGGLYVHDYQVVKKISPDGRVEPGAGTVPNNGPYPGYDAPQPAGIARLDCPAGLDVGTRGEVFVGDSCAAWIDVIDAGMPGFSGEELAVPSKDGEEIYRFTEEGRHLETLDALTGEDRFTFGYDSAGRLTSVTDGDGDVTEVERNAAGDPTAIVSPDGDRTPLTIGSGGMLAEIENPKGEAYEMTYGSGGLLASFTDPRNHTSTFEYDPLGRLERDEDAAGGFKTLTREGDRDTYDVTVETKLGRKTKHRVEPRGAGGTLRTKTDPAGLVTKTDEGSDGTTTVTQPDGTVATSKTQGDPRFGTQSSYVSRAEVRTPAGRSRVVQSSRTTTGATPGNPHEFAKLTDTTTINGRNWTKVFDRPTRTFTSTSPAGRTSVTTVNGMRRPLSESAPGLTTTTYSYDTRGRPSGSTRGTRTTSVTYDSAGNVDTETDSLGRTTSYDYDTAGRVTQTQLPGGRTVGYSYDAAGNLTGVTPPGRATHLFAFGPTGLLDDYDPPDVAQTALPTTLYTYDDDHKVIEVDRPDRAAPITFDYEDTTGRLASTSAPSGAGGATESTTYAYDAMGHLKTLTAASGEVLTFTVDGPLPVEQALAGDVAGRVNQSYDTEQRLASETVNGAHAVSYGYDADDLLSSVGALTITRDPVVNGTAQKNGLVASTALGTIAETRSYNAFGEPTARVFTAGGQPLFASDVTRDNGGRIEARTETEGGEVTGHGYVYDAAGRLDIVTNTAPGGSTTTTDYAYDGNGNRTQRTRGSETTTYTYDEQDRLTRAGTVDFTYDANGQLRRRQDSADTADDTRYGYDAYGQLRDVELADGRDLRYVLDGTGRRVGKKVDGQLAQGFLYSGDQLVAELNPDSSVKSRFVYATRSHVPDYMTQGTLTYRFVTDELGSVRLVVNSATGEVVQELTYDEFGVVTGDTNPGFQPFGYAGGLYDRDTKLVHFGAREYSAETGRWTAKDPIGFAGGDTNLYGYVFSDPINLVDPSGLVFGIPGTPSFEDISEASAGVLDGLSGGLSTELAGTLLGFDADCAQWGSAFKLGQGVGTIGGLAFGGAGAVSAGSRLMSAVRNGSLRERFAGLGRRLADETGTLNPGARTWRTTVNDFRSNPGGWTRTSAHVENSRRHRGGINVEEVFEQGGEWLVRHRIYGPGGNILKESYRPYAKF